MGLEPAEHVSDSGPGWSVIVPTCDRPADLARCLDCLVPGEQTLGADAYEVLVADDGRTAPARAALAERYPWVRWVPGPRRGPAANRNAGARAARGAWLAFTDDDCLPEKGWLAAFAAAGEEGAGAPVLEGRTAAPGPPAHPGQHAPVNERGGLLWSCNFAIRATLFRDLGGFDERFPFACMEDVELRHRLAARGVATRFVAEASVIHPWRDFDEAADSDRYWKSLPIYLAIHPGERARMGRRFHLELAARSLARGLKTALPRGEWRFLAGRFRAVFRSLREVAKPRFAALPRQTERPS